LTAVPDIVEKGVVIHKVENHKGRGFSSATIANKVFVDGTDAVMAVVILQTSANRYKAHRVLTPDGEHLKL